MQCFFAHLSSHTSSHLLTLPTKGWKMSFFIFPLRREGLGKKNLRHNSFVQKYGNQTWVLQHLGRSWQGKVFKVVIVQFFSICSVSFYLTAETINFFRHIFHRVRLRTLTEHQPCCRVLWFSKSSLCSLGSSCVRAWLNASTWQMLSHLILTTTVRWGNRGPGRLSHFPKVTQSR